MINLRHRTLLGLTAATVLLGSCSSLETATPATSKLTVVETSSSETANTDAVQPVDTDQSSESTVGLTPDRLAMLLALLGDGNEFASVYTQDHNSVRLTPWTGEETPEDDRSLFESEIGFPSDQIEAIADSERGIVVAATSANPDDAVERVVTASPWADLAAVETVGEFELIGFGSTLDLDRKSLIRPIGQPGELAFTDGFIIWSPEIGEVRRLIERGMTQRYSGIASAVAELGEWSELTVHPSQSVDSRLVCDTCSTETLANARAAMTQFGNPVRFESSTIVQNQGDSEFVILIEHATPELAATNAVTIPEVFDRADNFNTRRPMTEDFDLDGVEVRDSFVVLFLTEKLAEPSDVIFMSYVLAWDN